VESERALAPVTFPLQMALPVQYQALAFRLLADIVTCALRRELPDRRSRRHSPPFLLCFRRFRGVRCREFPIPVWLGAQGTRAQFASFPDRCTTGITRDG
jgi:hypothetical protein